MSRYIKADESNNCLYGALYRAWLLCRHILLNIYDCHIAYVCCTANILNRYTDPTFYTYVPKHNQLQLYFSCYCQICARNKLGIYATYAKYFKDLYGRCVHIYVPYMMSLQWTMWQWTLYTYLTYITKQLWLPNCTYMFPTYRPNISTQTTQICSHWYKQLQSNRHKCEK